MIFQGSSQPRDQAYISYISCIGRQVFTPSATWEAPFPQLAPVQQASIEVTVIDTHSH